MPIAFYIHVYQCDQCDQMHRLLGRYFAIYYNEDLPTALEVSQRRFKILPNTKKSLKNWPNVFAKVA